MLPNSQCISFLGVYSPEIDTYLGAGLITEGLNKPAKSYTPGCSGDGGQFGITNQICCGY